MIVVDTSVWIDALRGADRPTVETLQRLIDEREVGLAEPVRVEILSGASRAAFARVLRALEGLPLLRPADACWRRIEEWLPRAVASGNRFGVADLLIAAIAAEQGATVWSRDGDFARMAALGWVETYDPRS